MLTGKQLIGFSDADFAGDQSDHHSTSGYCFLLTSGLISCSSKKQSVVALSTANAECVALSQATQEAIWLRRLFSEIGKDVTPVVIMDDSQAAIAMAQNPVHHAWSKHIDMQFHFVREELEKKSIEVQFCPTNDMTADLLTEPLPREQFKKLCTQMGVQDSAYVQSKGTETAQ